jgi:hypothetical protein
MTAQGNGPVRRSRGAAGAACGLLLALAGGCLGPQPAQQRGWLDRLKQLGGPQGADLVVMDVAVLERPAGDRYLNGALWSTIDEQSVDLERRALLEDNGLRVGQLGGMLPAGLQSLLTTDRGDADRHRVWKHSGTGKLVALGGVHPKMQFQLLADGKPTPVALENAQWQLQVVPTLLADGRVKLTITPQAEHGRRGLLPQAGEDGFSLQGQRPTERYAALTWDVTLAAQEYVVVGTRFDQPGTLGHACFVDTDVARPVQRLLVIRANRGGDAAGPTPAGAEAAAPGEAPPLALRAARTTVRGSGP